MAADLQGQIQITADASGVEVGIAKAKRSLADLGAAAQSAGTKASAGLASAGGGGDAAAASVDRATKNIAASIERATAALNAGGRATSGYFSTLAAQKGANTEFLKPLLADLDAANAKSANAAHGMDGFSFATAGAKRELLVLVHELSQGNFARFGGSLLVLGERTGAASLLFSGMTVAIGGAVAVLGAFGVAASQGAAESKALTDSLILTGDASGATYSGLTNAAKGIAAIAGTRGAAAEALTALSSTGAVAGQNFEKFGLVAVKLSRDVGTSVEDTAKQFAELGRAPVDASVKLNESLHYLSVSTYEQIKGLQDQGRESDAASAAQNAYADAMLSRTAQIEANLGTLGTAWKTLSDAARAGWDAMLNVGREASVSDRLSDANKAVVAAQDRLANLGKNQDGSRNFANRGANYGGTAAIQEQLQASLAVQSSLTRQALLQDNVATSAKAAADATSARISFDKQGEQYLTQQERIERAIAKARSDGALAGASQAEIEKRVAAIRDSASKGPAPRNTDRSSLNIDLGVIKDALAERLDAYKNAQSLFNAQRSAGLVSDQQYYEQERVMIELNEAAQVKAIDAQIKALQSKTFTGPNAENQSNQNDKDINKLIADRNKLYDDGKTKATALDIEETSAQNKRLAGYMANSLAAQRSLDQTQKQYDLDLASARLSPEATQQLAGRAQITNKYANDLQALNDKKATQQKAGTFNADAESDYNAEFALIQNFQQKSLASYDAYYDRRKQQDADYTVGLDRATATYIENSQNVAKLTEQAYSNTFSNLENALTSLATTGKANFKGLADSIIADFVRIEVKQQESKLLSSFSSNAGGIGGDYAGGLIGVLGGIAGLFTGNYSYNNGVGFANAAGISGGRASGGPVGAGQLVQVDEHGPELLQFGGKQYLMMGNQSGNVVPNGGSSTGSGGVNIDQSRQVINVGQGVSRGEVAAALRSQANATEQRIRRLARNGNL